MAHIDLTPSEIESLVGSRDAATGIEYPPQGLVPYYPWLVRSLNRLAQSSAGVLRVERDDANDTTVRIAPGRCTLNGVALDYPGATQDLSSYNNDTAILWIEDGAGSPSLGIDALTNGFPDSPHIRLASVTLQTGVITQITDLRFESLLSHQKATAIADLSLTVSNPPTQSEVQAISDKVDAILSALRSAGLMSA
ncbi:MAG: hypothetical protein GC164_02585 [Phycisphaera sp.]|nr:hypothetical protein [Phycisphaera sp.]